MCEWCALEEEICVGAGGCIAEVWSGRLCVWRRGDGGLKGRGEVKGRNRESGKEVVTKERRVESWRDVRRDIAGCRGRTGGMDRMRFVCVL